MWLRARALLRDLVDVDRRSDGDASALAREDDVLDAWLDEDEMDTTGL